MKLWGHVVGKGLQGEGEFHTNSLQYDAKDRKITTPDRVRFQGAQYGLEGNGMVVYMDTEEVSIMKDVRALWKR